MPHERDRNRDDPDMLDELGNKPRSPRERLEGTSKEHIRGIAEDEEFEDVEDVEDEDVDEEEGDGTI